MFTGIIQSVQEGEISNFVLKIRRCFKELYVGESIAVNGVCLTLTSYNDRFMFFHVGLETFERTNLKDSKIFNLEKSLTLGSGISGHFVTGHVDGTLKLSSVSRIGNTMYMKFSMPNERWAIVKKGSITLNGVSLTIAFVDLDTFTIQVIPHTYENTNFKYLKIGDDVNYEIDLFARYIKGVIDNNTNNIKESDFKWF